MITKLQLFSQEIWAVRERISEGLLHDGYVFKYDFSLPLENFYKIVEIIRERLTDPRVRRVTGFGHLGKAF